MRAQSPRRNGNWLEIHFAKPHLFLVDGKWFCRTHQGHLGMASHPRYAYIQAIEASRQA